MSKPADSPGRDDSPGADDPPTGSGTATPGPSRGTASSAGTGGASEPDREGTRFVFLDCEATGLDVERQELTEIAWIVRFEDGQEVERQYFPRHTLDAADEAALELTDYERRIAPQPRTPLSEWLHQFLADAQDAVIVGAVPDFDVRHLLKACHRLEVEPTWDHHLLDVEVLALPLLAGGPEPPRGLASTCRDLGVPHDKDRAHGALYDARQARAVFDRVWEVLGELRRDGRPLPPPVPRSDDSEDGGEPDSGDDGEGGRTRQQASTGAGDRRRGGPEPGS